MHLDLTEEETAALARLLRRTIDDDRYPLSPRIQTLKTILGTVNALLIRALMQYYSYYGDNFRIDCPTGSGNSMNLFEVAQELANRLTSIFLRDQAGHRPVFGGAAKFQNDPYWRDHLLFYEYFHGDNGAGIGASHQTGWTGVVAALIEIFGHLDARTFLEHGREAAFEL
jgi:hypothetical protein